MKHSCVGKMSKSDLFKRLLVGVFAKTFYELEMQPPLTHP
jgi:hypothetical protein